MDRLAQYAALESAMIGGPHNQLGFKSDAETKPTRSEEQLGVFVARQPWAKPAQLKIAIPPNSHV